MNRRSFLRNTLLTGAAITVAPVSVISNPVSTAVEVCNGTKLPANMMWLRADDLAFEKAWQAQQEAKLIKHFIGSYDPIDDNDEIEINTVLNGVIVYGTNN